MEIQIHFFLVLLFFLLLFCLSEFMQKSASVCLAGNVGP